MSLGRQLRQLSVAQLLSVLLLFHFNAQSLATEHKLWKRDRVWNHQIRCIGPMAPGLPWSLDIDGNPVQGRTPRSLCADENYGGSSRGNLGGFCNTDAPEIFVQFDPITYPLDIEFLVERNFFDAMNAAMVFCQLRCRCLHNARRSRPSRTNSWPALEIEQSEPPDPQRYDKNPAPPRPTNEALVQVFNFGGLENGIRIVIGSEFDDVFRGMSLFCPREIIQPLNYADPQGNPRPVLPRCLDTLPLFLPHPFTRHDYRNSVELCASVFHGGSTLGNAGGVCSSVGSGSRRRDQFKLKALLSHPSYLSSNGDLGLSAWLWCYSACTCNPDETLTQKKVAVPRWKNEELYAEFLNGITFIKQKDGASPRNGIPNTLMPATRDQQTNGHRSRSCGQVDDDGLCVDVEPESDVCNKVCASNAQCGPSCVCVAQRTHNSEFESSKVDAGSGLGGSVGRYLFASCMALTAYSASSHHHLSNSLPVVRGSSLHGREIFKVECLCNRTFASTSCCEEKLEDWKGRERLKLLKLA